MNGKTTTTAPAPVLNWRYRVAGDNNGEILPSVAIPYCKPRSINWRYQVEGESLDAIELTEIPYVKPRSINWRYQNPTDRSDELN